MEDVIFYFFCFDVNGGLFEMLLGVEDVIIFDVLNYVFIIDGVCLCKVKCYCYVNNDMQEFEVCLKEVCEVGVCYVLIVIDGVFLMDGVIVNLKGVCDLVDKYDVLVMVDDFYVVGFVGENGCGFYEYCDVMGCVDIIIGMFGKVLGGVFGGYIVVCKEVVEWLCQCFCLYLFFNLLVLVIVVVFIKVLEMVEVGSELCDCLWVNVCQFCG